MDIYNLNNYNKLQLYYEDKNNLTKE